MIKVMKTLLFCLTFVVSSMIFSGNAFAWGGHDNNGTPVGTHPFIVESALNILGNDLSPLERKDANFMAVFNTLKQYISDLKKGSIAPDYSPKDISYGKRHYAMYQDHFFDPDNRENYTVRVDSRVASFYVFRTAQYRAEENIARALEQWRKHNIQVACSSLGEALHYFCDITELHHAANVISGTEEPDSFHSSFEYWVEASINDPAYKVKTIGSTASGLYTDVMAYPFISDFLLAESIKVGRYAKNYYLQKFTKPTISNVADRTELILDSLNGNPLDVTSKYLTDDIIKNWQKAAIDNLANAQKATARVLYRFIKEAAQNVDAHRTTTTIHLSIKTKDDSFPYMNDYGTYDWVFFGVELYDGRVKEFKLGNDTFYCNTTKEFDVELKDDDSCRPTEIRKIWIRKQRYIEDDDWYPEYVKVLASGAGSDSKYTFNINRWIKGNSGLILDIGSNNIYNLRSSPISLPEPIKVANRVFAAGSAHCVALNSNRTLLAWGSNDDGKCNVPGGNDFVAVSGGARHGVAMKLDGSLVAWGGNTYGECKVPAEKNYLAVASYYHNVALKSDGSLVAWGLNDYGQCNVPAGNDFAAVAVGDGFSVALKSDGSLVEWGINETGEYNVPAGNDFVSVASGWYHSVALKSDGSLVAWGDNEYGQCDMPTGNDFVAVAAGYFHTVALKSDGSLVARGHNGSGQCNVPAGNDFVAISVGACHSIALRSDGSLVAWGENDRGQCNVPAGLIVWP